MAIFGHLWPKIAMCQNMTWLSWPKIETFSVIFKHRERERLFVIVFAYKSRLFILWHGMKSLFYSEFLSCGREPDSVSKLKYMAPFSDGKDAINNSKAFQNVIELQKRWRAAQGKQSLLLIL